ncbi:GNAT family N-acetyltransferase [Phyllobacterium leguminum]|uniref:Ribosomal-protein-alanine N-acetyltransferase n=1 Tax=Phyllobacterium leguminum TaxID=314237 RepID=A0A318TK68_9HYPH|nr:GNAT family N-acetyltransferase [Phyllobacterium leguminum]PYE89680.1 ribosomal-protein-alanine N-acetyltransferase [Phyllobacterium leguminum]
MIIRRASVGDSAALAGVGCRAWASMIFRFEPERPGIRERAERAFRAFADEFHHQIVLAELAGAVVGWGARDTGADYISDLWIDPAFQRRGIGFALMDALLAEIVLSGYGRACIETHARNLPAIRLYERCGFRIIRRGEEWSDSFCRKVEKVSMELLLGEDLIKITA